MKNKLRKLMIALFTTTLVVGSPMTVFADEIHGRDVTFEDYEYPDDWDELEPGATMQNGAIVLHNPHYYQYDSAGNITCMITEFRTGGTYYIDYEYDELNRLVKKIDNSHSSLEESKKITEYQYIGNDINVLKYYKGKQPELKTVYSLNDSGKLVRLLDVYTGNTEEFQYDVNNNLIAVIRNGSVKDTYTYDSMNRLIEWNTTGYKCTYKYNSENQIIQEDRFDTDNNCIMYMQLNYTYDTFGNYLTIKDSINTYTANYVNDYDEAGRLLRVTENVVDEDSSYSSVKAEYAY